MNSRILEASTVVYNLIEGIDFIHACSTIWSVVYTIGVTESL